MAGSYRWHGEAVQAQIRSEMGRRIDAACIVVDNRAKVLLSVAGTASRGKGRKKVYGATRSKPGEPPRKQTGHLRRSVTRERDGLVGRVGTNLKYGRWLELGTRLMAARPWLRRSLSENQARIKALLTAPMRMGGGR